MNTPISEGLPPVLTNKFGEKFLHGVNRSTFMGGHSHTVYRSWFGEEYLQENSLYIVLGTDSGLLVAYFLAQELPTGTSILFVELQEVIDWLQQAKPELFTEHNRSITIHAAPAFIADIERLQLENYVYLDKFFITRSFAATDMNYPPYRAMTQEVLQVAENYHWSVKTALSTRAFTVNQLFNLTENRTHVAVLNDSCKEMTAIILAGGPSLEHCIPWLRKHGNTIMILAVSRISRRLQQVGITPDIIFSIDPNPINFNVSKEMFAFADHALLVNGFHLYPKLLAQWSGRHVHAGNLFPWQSDHNRNIAEKSGSTVTNFALETAINMGFSTIYLAGVDLCYDQQGFSHARGSMEHDAGPVLEGGETTIMTNDGRMAETTFAYKTAAANLSALAAWGRVEKKTRVINTNPAAAKMEYIQYCSIEDLGPPASFKAKKNPAALFPAETGKQRSAHYTRVLKEVQRARRSLRRMEKLAVQALLANKQLFATRGRKRPFIEQMDKIEKTLNSARFTFIRNLVKTYGISHFLTIIRPDPDAEWSNKEIEESGRQYYKAYRKSARELRQLLEACERRIVARLEEEKQVPDFSTLITSWQKDNIPGRVLVMKKHHREVWTQVDDATQIHLATLEADFQRLVQEGLTLARTPLGHLSEWTPQRCRKIRTRMLDLYQQQNRAALAQIGEELAIHDQPLVHPLVHLAQGLLAELDGDVAGASAQYESIIQQGDDTDPRVLEDALHHVCTIALDNGQQDSAVLALQCLYALSMHYGPQYARILALTGRVDEALDVYADYLGQTPNDINAMLALGNLYRQLNFPDGVAMVVDHVLAQAPGNPEALQLQEFCS